MHSLQGPAHNQLEYSRVCHNLNLFNVLENKSY